MTPVLPFPSQALAPTGLHHPSLVRPLQRRRDTHHTMLRTEVAAQAAWTATVANDDVPMMSANFKIFAFMI